jgi:AraC-like DNA-binding protein
MSQPITIESPPSGFTSIVFNYGDSYKTSSTDISDFKVVPKNFIAGQATKTYKLLLEGRIGMIGIVFRPAAINTLFGIQMYELNDERLDLRDVLGKEIVPVQDRIIEAQSHQERVEIIERFLLFKVLNCKNPVNQTDFAANLIVDHKGIINISKMMEELYVCRRQLERQFLQKVGVSPKYYARIRRISYLCSIMANKRWQVADWHDLIYQMGYYDQSHFIKEFTAFTGKSPSFYLKNNLELSNYLQS